MLNKNENKMLDALKQKDFSEAINYIPDGENEYDYFVNKVAEVNGLKYDVLRDAGYAILEHLSWENDDYESGINDFCSDVVNSMRKNDLFNKFYMEIENAFEKEDFDKAYDYTLKLGKDVNNFFEKILIQYGTDQRILNLATDCVIRNENLNPTEMSSIINQIKQSNEYQVTKRYDKILELSEESLPHKIYKKTIQKFYDKDIIPKNYGHIYAKNSKDLPLDMIAILKLAKQNRNNKNYTIDNAINEIYNISPSVIKEDGFLDKNSYVNRIYKTIKKLEVDKKPYLMEVDR